MENHNSNDLNQQDMPIHFSNSISSYNDDVFPIPFYLDSDVNPDIYQNFDTTNINPDIYQNFDTTNINPDIYQNFDTTNINPDIYQNFDTTRDLLQMNIPETTVVPNCDYEYENSPISETISNGSEITTGSRIERDTREYCTIQITKVDSKEFENYKSFAQIKYINGEVYLETDFVKYCEERGEKVKNFEKICRSTFLLIFKGEETDIKEERLRYQKRKSKRLHKETGWKTKRPLSEKAKQARRKTRNKKSIFSVLFNPYSRTCYNGHSI